MKRKLFLPCALALAVAITGCAKVEVDAQYQPSDDVESIGMSVATAKTLARGASASVATLQASELSVAVISTKDGNSVPATTLTIGYTYDGADWSQTSDASYKWSEIDYPSNFYSMLHSTATALNSVAEKGTAQVFDITAASGAAAASVAKIEFTPSDAGLTNTHNQIDLLYAGIQVAALPAAGKATMNFYHALSKVDIYAATELADTINTVYIQDASIKYMDGTAEFDIAASIEENQVAEFWTLGDNSGVNYGYMQHYNSAITPITSAKAVLLATKDEDYGSMMILPQTTVGFDVSQTNTVIAAEIAAGQCSYVEVIYYGTKKDANSNTVTFAGAYADDESLVIGFDAVASANERYFVSSADTTTISKTAYDAAPDSYPNAIPYPAAGDPLSVKVAFPLTNIFAMGKYYHITLGFGGLVGSTGGYLVESNFYDQSGNKLPLTLNTQYYLPGDPVLADADGLIGIAVTLADWETNIIEQE